MYALFYMYRGGLTMNRKFFNAMEDSPVIAAVKNEEGLEKCCGLEDIKVVFILYGDICNIAQIIEKIKQADKIAMVHIDLINGLSSKEVSVDFIKNNTRADGIITTRQNLVKRAKELKLYTILRFFLIDSLALENIEKQQYGIRPDFIEVLPGLMPKMIERICQISNIPLIAGGLIQDKESVMAALNAGAVCVSTTNQNVWLM